MTTPIAASPQPTANKLPSSPYEGCDRCNAQALFEIILPSGGRLTMCGHDARKSFGITEKTWLHAEEKQKGSDH